MTYSELFDEFEGIFGPIRLNAFNFWEIQTKRDCSLINDDFSNSYECKWQDRAIAEFGFEHVSIFCSLGDWANNVSDILKDETCDLLIFSNKEDQRALYRYYTRFLLVLSELLIDFIEIAKKKTGPTSKPAHNFLSRNKKEIESLVKFINNVCKHKEVVGKNWTVL